MIKSTARKKLALVIMAVSSRVSLGCSQQTLPDHECAFGFAESRSWIDSGFKMVIFPSGDGYIYRLQTERPNNVDQELRFFKIHLAQNELNSLAQTLEHNNFLSLKKEMLSQVTDGTDIDIYYANGRRYNKVHNYMVQDERISRITAAFSELCERKSAAAPTVSKKDMIAGFRAGLKAMAPSSPAYRCVKDVLNTLCRPLWACNLVSKEDVADLITEGIDH